MTGRRSNAQRRDAGATGKPDHRKARCAIYTRVSTDQGLDQEFNSLDAQREACSAFVRSQMHEGWMLAPVGPYDDGGFSGGSLDRPALQALLADIRAKKIDTVVVYKVDRLTRSLADFAKLIELFEAHQVSFVSVTQSFNTTTSMGRLTLNVLLSFAQFEREVASERIRDKVAASKKKGIWVGGVVPLGYRVENRRLVIDEAEAVTVRMIFERYLALGSMTPLLAELRQKGVVTRRRTLATGRVIGGVPFGRGALGHLLQNRTYVGELNHRDKSYPGEHPPLMDRSVFDAVQARLIENRTLETHRQMNSEALLLGRIFDDRGNRMSPTHSRKDGARYRYYTSRALSEGRRQEAGSVPRVPAPDVEALVLEAVHARHLGQSGDPGSLGLPVGLAEEDPPGARNDSDRALLARLVERVVIFPKSVEVQFSGGGHSDIAPRSISIPWSKPPTRRQSAVLHPSYAGDDDPRLITPKARDNLLDAIVTARRWLDDLVTGAVLDLDALAAREARSERSVRMTLSLAFLAPSIIRAIIEARLPAGIGPAQLSGLPPAWREQKERFERMAAA